MVTRIGIIGDVHTEAETLLRALEHLRGIDVEQLVCLGDIVDGFGDGYDVDECCHLLQDFQVLTICGNHDRWLLEDSMRDLDGATDRLDLAPSSIAFLESLPATAELDTPLGKLLVCHGVGRDDMATVFPHDHGHALTANQPLQALLSEGRYAITVAGHTHRRMVRRLGEMTLINAGTLHRNFMPCFGFLDLASDRLDFIAPTGERLERRSVRAPDA